MSKHEHTRGSWEVRLVHHGLAIFCAGRRIAFVDVTAHSTMEEAEAVAWLIAAAPDLRKALREVADSDMAMREMERERHNGCASEVLGMVATAIANAKGM